MTELRNSSAELEVRRIARLVALDPEELADLLPMGAEDLATLRDQITGKLFDEHSESWERAVAVAGVVPAGMAAKLSEKALGPVLSARVTALTPPDTAVAIGAKLSPAFMADVAVNVDPRRITDIVVAMPPQTIAAVGRELASRREWLVMADFVAAVTDPTLQTVLDALDDRAVLRIAPLLQDRDRLSRIVGMLDDDRLDRLRQVAVDEGLQADLRWIAEQVDHTQRDRVRQRPAGAGDQP